MKFRAEFLQHIHKHLSVAVIPDASSSLLQELSWLWWLIHKRYFSNVFMDLEVDLQKEVPWFRVWAAISAQQRGLQSALGALALVGRREHVGRGRWASVAWNASSLDHGRGWLCDRHQQANTQTESGQPLACTEGETWALKAFRHLQMIPRDSLTVLAGCSFSLPLRVLEPPLYT